MELSYFGTSFKASWKDENPIGLVALNANTGEFLWSHPTDCVKTGSPVIENGTVYVLACSTIHAVSLHGNNNGTTNEKWPAITFGSGSSFGTEIYWVPTPVIVGEKLIVQWGLEWWANDAGVVYDSEGSISAINKTTGNVIWGLPMWRYGRSLSCQLSATI